MKTGFRAFAWTFHIYFFIIFVKNQLAGFLKNGFGEVSLYSPEANYVACSFYIRLSITLSAHPSPFYAILVAGLGTTSTLAVFGQRLLYGQSF